MTRKEVSTILDGMLEWYKNPDNIYYDSYLLEHTEIGAKEWDTAKETFTKEQEKKWSRILLYYKNRLEELGVNKEGSANFIRDKLKQDNLWKSTLEDKVEESEFEKILDEVSELLQKPVQKLADNQLEIIKKQTETKEEE